jgi:hypothetical protein
MLHSRRRGSRGLQELLLLEMTKGCSWQVDAVASHMLLMQLQISLCDGLTLMGQLGCNRIEIKSVCTDVVDTVDVYK